MSTPKKLPLLIQKEEGVEYRKQCEHHHECMQAIRLILDGEATTEQIAHFKANINHCLPCIENHNLEVTIRQILCDKIQQKTVPEDLIQSIRTQILNKTSEVK